MIIKLYTSIFLVFFSINGLSATYFESSIQKKNTQSNILLADNVVVNKATIKSSSSLTMDYVFVKLTSHLQAKDVLNYKKINLKITGANPWTPFYRSIQIDVQKTLLESHYDKNELDEIKLIEAATIGLTKWTDDRFTTYFPPTENKTFMETLEWKFEWIWSYVEMQEPWILRIVTPIAGSPSEKAWLKWGDQITHADGKEITVNTSIWEAISWGSSMIKKTKTHK